MEPLERLARVPWLGRILVAICIVVPIFTLLYFPLLAAITIWLVCLLAAFEHLRLRARALQPLTEGVAVAKAGGNANDKADDKERGRDNTYRGNKGQASQKNTCGGINEDGKELAVLTAAYRSPLLLMVCCSGLFVAEALDPSKTPGFSFLCVAACVSTSVAGCSILTYAWHPHIPESRAALLYAWAAAGLDLYFLWHYAVPLALGSFVLRRSGGLPLAASLIAVSAAGDTGALFCGSAFGRQRIVKKLSPNKTLAGFCGSFVCSLITTALLWHLAGAYPHLGLLPIHLTEYLVLGAMVSIAGQFGDLIESAFKRCAGVKDSSSLFGPHGGMLDRLDSLVLPIPFLVLFLTSRGHF